MQQCRKHQPGIRNLALRRRTAQRQRSKVLKEGFTLLAQGWLLPIKWIGLSDAAAKACSRGSTIRSSRDRRKRLQSARTRPPTEAAYSCFLGGWTCC